MDFTLSTYHNLINILQQQGFSFQTLSNFLEEPGNKAIVLRHDVDALPQNSLEFARIQAEKGIRGTYYFRIVPESFDERIIKEIFSMGHEIGYHYEDVTRCAVPGLRHAAGCRSPVAGCQSVEDLDYEKTLIEISIESFKKNLEKLRKIVPVNTICMHGSPMSQWDSRLLWKYYDYHDFGIIGEPYFDINFKEVLYLTDTGRRWDGDSFNIRDKATSDRRPASGLKDMETKRLKDKETSCSPLVPQSLSSSVFPAPRTPHPAPFTKLHSTVDIIRAAEAGQLPDKIMMTFHPQRWTDKPLPWVRELVWQNVKNVVKYFIVKVNS